MDTTILASKAIIQICVPDQDDSTSYQYTMDLTLEGNTFCCKLSTNARLISPDKKVPVYLFLDAGYVHSLEVCDNQTEVIPRSVASGFVERAVCASLDDIVALQFRLKCDAPLFAPDSLLQKRRSNYDEIKNLLQIGRHETFVVYISSNAIDRKRLSRLCLELSKGTLKPVPKGIIKSLYHPDVSSQVITHLDQLSSLYSQGLPPYEPSMAIEASHTDLRPSTQGKRRSISPAVHQTPSKRQLLTEKPVVEPWQLAIAAQGAQIAALSAELSALREQVQQLQRAPVVDAWTQTDPVVEHEPEVTPETNLISSPVHSPVHSAVHSLVYTPVRSPVHSPAYQPVYSPAYQPVYSSVYPPVYPPVFNSQATVEITIDERFIMLEGNMDERFTKLEQDIVDEQTQRSTLDEQIVQNNKLLHENLELESCSLHLLVKTLTSRVDDLESEICDDLRKEFSDSIDAKGLELQVKLEEFCEHRLEDIEEVVKHDVRIAFEHSECKISLGWKSLES